jgi:exoribonuclease R
MAERKNKARRKKNQNRLQRKLTVRSQSARDRALHALAAMRKDQRLSLTRAAKLQGVKQETVKRYFPTALKKSSGKFRVTKSDRYSETLYLPDRFGNPAPVPTRSSKERREASEYLRDLGRYLRGERNALSKWHGKNIAGVELVTAGRTIANIEPALSDFSLYRAFNTGAA